MANSKVQLADGTVLMDLTGDTVAASTLLNGTTAHDKAGNAITGTLVPGIVPSGTLSITDNGTYNVTNYASANVALTFQVYRTGSGAPPASLGNDGDLYFDLG